MEIPETRYARSGELAIAYQAFGAGDYDLLLTTSSAQNVQALWSIPEAARLLERLGRFARVIHYDRRDSGSRIRSGTTSRWKRTPMTRWR